MSFYLRVARIVIGNLSTNDLRISFTVEKSLVGYPNKAQMQVYNLSQTSREQIEQEGARVELYAGYENGDVPLLFSGNIINVIHKKIGPDWISEIYALDSATALNTATINTTIPEGSTARDYYNTLIDNVEGITQGLTEGLTRCLNNRESLLRKAIRCGSIKKFLQELAEQCGFEYSVNEGVIETTEKGKPLTDIPPFIINQKSGMVGSPERTDVGVTVKNLLLPNLKLGRRIKIQSITEQLNVGNLYFRKVSEIRNPGVYRIDKLIHTGDTHDNPWYTEITGRIF